MVNGIGVVGWGVGGIEAEAAMLGQPVSMLIPRVVGFKLNGDLPEGATATDLVLTITEMLRKHGVVGKFVEFYGPGVSALPLANRATIGNMSPEFGSTIAVFPIDEETTKYLKLTGRAEEQLALVEAYAKEQGLWHDPDAEPRFSENLELDLADRRPVARRARSVRRTGSRCPTPRRRSAPRWPTTSTTATPEGGSDKEGVPAQEKPDEAEHSKVDEPSAESFPSSDAPSHSEGGNGDGAPHDCRNHPAGSGAGRPSNPAQVTLEDGTEFDLDHGAVTIAAITSCTNTSNPSVMIGAALLAKNAVEKGLTSKPWVKTTLAPGSKVVSDYYEQADLTPYLDKLGFNLVGYGCTTCIGNSGPLIPEVSEAVNENDLAVVSVLSGNRNFEGRINPDVKMNYLASPPLVVAYALAGSMDVDLFNDPLGQDQDGNDVFMKDIWPIAGGGRGGHRQRDHLGDVHQRLRRRLRRRRAVAVAADARGRHLRVGPGLDLRPQASVLRRHARRAGGRRPTSRARACCSSSATRSRPTTSARPVRSRRTAPRASTSPSTASSSATSTPTARAAATTR